MDLYHGWFDLKPGVSDIEFADHLRRYMEQLRADGLIAEWRLARRKLGLAPAALRELRSPSRRSALSWSRRTRSSAWTPDRAMSPSSIRKRSSSLKSISDMARFQHEARSDGERDG